MFRGRELVRQQELPDDPEREAKLIELRNKMNQFRTLKLAPLERGWSGPWLPGRKVGPPDPVNGGEHLLRFASIHPRVKLIRHLFKF